MNGEADAASCAKVAALLIFDTLSLHGLEEAVNDWSGCMQVLAGRGSALVRCEVCVYVDVDEGAVVEI
jgi:hypothetical protein